MIARAVGFVIVAVAAKMEQIEFVYETFALEEIDGAVNGDEMNFGIDFLGGIEDLVNVEMLLGRVHDLKDDPALAGETNAALAESGLQLAGGLGDVDAFAARDPMGGCGSQMRLLG